MPLKIKIYKKFNAWLVGCGGRIIDSTHASHLMAHNIGLLATSTVLTSGTH